MAIGPVFGTTEPEAVITRQKIQASDIGAESARLEAAIVQSRKQLAKLRARLAVLPEESQSEIAPLIDAYIRMLGPSRLVRGVRARIEETLLSAETAVMTEAERDRRCHHGAGGARACRRRTSRGCSRRADEIGEIARRLVRNLTRSPFRSFAGLPEGSILVAEELRPADAALLDPSRLAGVVTEEGGADGHTAVMLRALGVPAVLGAAGLAHAMQPGDVAVVDGIAGTVMLNPSAPTLAAARKAVTAFARERQRYARLRRLPAVTQDGEAVELQANLELPIELPLIVQSGAVGIGLLRTEFLFMNRETIPDEATQTESYRIDRRGDARRSGDHPRAGLGRREGDRGADPGRHRAGDRRHQSGPGPARDPAAAAAAGTAGDPVRRHPAGVDGRAGAGAAADGDDGRRGAGGARDLRTGGAAAAAAGRADPGEAAAAGHHDRDARAPRCPPMRWRWRRISSRSAPMT